MYIDEATLRSLFGTDRVDEYYPDSGGLALAIRMAEDRVYSAIKAAGHNKPPSTYSAIADVPALLIRAAFIALKENAYSNAGLAVEDLLTQEELGIFERLRTGQDEIPGVDVDSTVRSVGGVTFTERGVSATSSSRYHARIFDRGPNGMGTSW